MLAVVKEGPGAGFALREVPAPQLTVGTVLVRVAAVGICGTDLPIFAGIRKVPYPLIPGHEFAGAIAAVGAGVVDWHVGDRVAVGLVIGCGRCPACRRGEESLCPQITEIGIHIDGAFAEYVRVPVSCLHRLPPHLSFRQGAAVDPIASAYRGVRRMAPQPGDHVLVVGAGPIGLYALQCVRAHGVATASLLVRSPGRRASAALALGATRVIDSSHEDATEALEEVTDGSQASLVIEATGNPAVLDEVLALCAPGARVLVLGIFHSSASFYPQPVVRQELRVEGSFCYNWTDFELSLDLLARGQVTTDHVVTHVLPLQAMGQALDLLQRREAVKVILEPAP